MSARGFVGGRGAAVWPSWLALLLASLVGCAAPSASRGGARTSDPHAAQSGGLHDDQLDAESENYSALVWAADADQPSLWSLRGGRDLFVPRVALRFVTPVGYTRDERREPSQRAVLEGPTVPRAMRGERLAGDRVIQLRGAAPSPVVVSLLELPLDVEPATFCAWAARSVRASRVEVVRDEAARLASTATRACELRADGETTRVRGFLRAGWLLVFTQRLVEGAATTELDALVASVRDFDAN